MLFFTDITTNVSNFCLLHISKYYDCRKKRKKLVFVDPGVYELKKSNEYSHRDLLHKLASGYIQMQSNEFISIDYPCDMNPKFSYEFIQKTYENNVRYAHNSQYICTVQSNFLDFPSFLFNMNRTKYIWSNSNKILGMGNLCRLIRWSNNPESNSYKIKLYLDKVFYYLVSHADLIDKIHFYGIGIQMIREYIPKINRLMEITIDSTKFTKRIHKNPPLDKSICCRKHDRDLYFLEYMKEIKKYVNVEY